MIVSDPDAGEELWVEDAAARLGLPADMLVRRIEAGVLSARRVAEGGRLRYVVRASEFPAVAEEEPQASAPLPYYALHLPPTAPPAEPEMERHPEAAVRTAELLGVPDTRQEPRQGADPPGDGTALNLVDPEALSTSTLDARELVAALLDRFERTLDQRVHAEYQLRFASRIGELERELEDVRAQGASRAAELERGGVALQREVEVVRNRAAARTAELERVIGALQRELEEARALAATRTAERERAIVALEREIDEARALASSHAAEVRRAGAAHAADLDTRDRATAALRREMAELQARADLVAERDAALEQRGRETERLQADVASARRAAAEHERTSMERVRALGMRDREASTLRERLAESDRLADGLRAEIAERDRALDDLHTILVQRDRELDELRGSRRRGRFRR